MAHGNMLLTIAATAALLIAARAPPARACTTLVAGRLATADGSVLAAHSNDGDGGTAGNLRRVPPADWPAGAQRKVQGGGSIPQVNHTHAYFTKVGGYAAMNEYQVPVVILQRTFVD